jgi:hypothetical protein
MSQEKEPPRHIPAPYAPKRVVNPHAGGPPRPHSTPAHPPVRTRTTVRRTPPR